MRIFFLKNKHTQAKKRELESCVYIYILRNGEKSRRKIVLSELNVQTAMLTYIGTEGPKLTNFPSNNNKQTNYLHV